VCVCVWAEIWHNGPVRNSQLICCLWSWPAVGPFTCWDLLPPCLSPSIEAAALRSLVEKRTDRQRLWSIPVPPLCAWNQNLLRWIFLFLKDVVTSIDSGNWLAMWRRMLERMKAREVFMQLDWFMDFFSFNSVWPSKSPKCYIDQFKSTHNNQVREIITTSIVIV